MGAAQALVGRLEDQYVGGGMETWQTLASVVGPLVIGCLVTWWVSRLYYRKSSEETRELRHLALVTIGSLEAAGLITVTYDAQGLPHRVVLLSGTATGAGTVSGTLSASPPSSKP